MKLDKIDNITFNTHGGEVILRPDSTGDTFLGSWGHDIMYVFQHALLNTFEERLRFMVSIKDTIGKKTGLVIITKYKE